MSQYDNLSQENKDFLVLVGQIEPEAEKPAPAPKAKATPAVDTPAESSTEGDN